MTRTKLKLLHYGGYVALVKVQLIETDEGWSPHLTLRDAELLDQVREALHQGNLTKATTLARVFHLPPAREASS